LAYTGLDHLDSLRLLLGESRLLVSLAPSEARRPLADRLERASVTLEAACGLLRAESAKEADVQRRELLKGAMALMGTPLLDRLTIVTPTTGNVADYARLLTLYAGSYDSDPVASLTDRVAGLSLRLHRLLDTRPDPRPAALSAYGQAEAFSGWLAFTGNAPVDARRHLDTATLAAVEAGDAELHAAVLMSLAEMTANTHPAYPHRERQFAEALDLANHAALLLPPGADPLLASWMAARHAVVLAANGCGAAFLDETDRAKALLTQAADPSRPGFFTVAGRFATWGIEFVEDYEAVGLYRLGRTASAERKLQHALATLHPRYARRRANILAGLGAAYLAAGEPREGAIYATRAAEVAGEINGLLHLERVRQLRPRFNAHGTVPELAALDECLRAA
jgi:hypothetical protein